MKTRSSRKKKAAKKKRLRGLRRRAPQEPNMVAQARKTKLFVFMDKLFKRHGLPGGAIVPRWGKPKINKYWELKEVRQAFEDYIDNRFFSGTRLSAQSLRMLYTALYLEADTSRARRRYREGMARISWMLNVPRRQLDRVLKSELKSVANRSKKFSEEVETIERYRNNLYSKYNPSGGKLSSQEKIESIASNLSAEEFKDYLVLTNAVDAAGQNLSVYWGSYAGNILEWLKEHKPLKGNNHNHNK